MIARMVAGVAALLALLLAGSPLLPAEPTYLSLENEFVRVVVNRGPDEAGRIGIRTTGGDPSRPASKNQHLIFGGNAPWTSYTTLLVDGGKYAFGGPTRRRAGQAARYGKVLTPPTVVDDKIAGAYQYGDVEVQQEVGLVRGPSTRMLDTVGITYRITNRGKSAHQVGLRVLLDTMCGANDGAPIRAGREAITGATALSAKDMPDFWQAFDSLSKPTVISQGTLRGEGLTPPDAVLFADWGTLADEPWEPPLVPGQGFVRKGEEEPDTATALLWNPAALDPGQSRTYTTYYGIGEVSLKAGTLTLGLTGPAEATFAHERTQPFTIAGYLQNTGGFIAREVALTLVLPEGLTLVRGAARSTSAEVKPDETIQQNWVVIPNGKSGGKVNLTLSAISANIEANDITRQIQVNVPAQKLHFTPGTQRVPATTNKRPTIIPVRVNLAPAEDFYGARFTVVYDPNVISPLSVSRGSAFVDGGRLLDGWEYDDSVDGRITITGRRTEAAKITQAEANLATITFRTVAQGKCALRLMNAVGLDEKGAERPLDAAAGEIAVVAE